ncbi:hypothetical protein MIND_01117900 [Mycena indigotica]|uniref:Uncharacterized protein n=1 Tax=Mycena indigotica TaxID=2126181 RepID=A0A8H6VZ45_9AGAR|nr:uncharacterized protein MIND_01117900 [Mycena indigotica]KAF7293409.1 hypothetical protein MIND_01117900 [Mycena indigotica]
MGLKTIMRLQDRMERRAKDGRGWGEMGIGELLEAIARFRCTLAPRISARSNFGATNIKSESTLPPAKRAYCHTPTTFLPRPRAPTRSAITFLHFSTHSYSRPRRPPSLTVIQNDPALCANNTPVA